MSDYDDHDRGYKAGCRPAATRLSTFRRRTGGGPRPKHPCRRCGHMAQAARYPQCHRKDRRSGGYVCRDRAACAARARGQQEPVPPACPMCDGSGVIGPWKCSTCRGQGKLSRAAAKYVGAAGG